MVINWERLPLDDQVFLLAVAIKYVFVWWTLTVKTVIIAEFYML